jgi:hypothetical protein
MIKTLLFVVFCVEGNAHGINAKAISGRGLRGIFKDVAEV